MTQPNSEQYREKTGLPSENVGSSPSAGNGQRIEGEGNLDFSKLASSLREPASSQVGYGGGDDKYVSTKGLQNQGHWEARENEDDSRFGQDTRGESDSGITGEQQQGDQSRYGPGGYGEGEEYNVGGGLADASSRSSQAYGRRNIEGSTAGDESEVRNGVPHRATSDGVASGVGISDALGGQTSDDIQQHAYHQVEVNPSQQKHSPYSQLFTEPDGPSKGSRDHFHEEAGVSGNTQGGVAGQHQRESAKAKSGADHEKEGLMTRLKHKIPGQSHDLTDSSSDIKGVDSNNVAQEDDEEEGFMTRLKHKISGQSHDLADSRSHSKGVDSDNVAQEYEDEKPGVVTTLKEKLLPSHEKHHDEIDPKFWG